MIFKAWKQLKKKQDPEKQEQLRQEPLEKGDRMAMLLAAFYTLFLPALGVLLLIGIVALLLFSLGSC